MKNTFFGGVFPPLHKENSRRKPVSPMDQPPAQVVIPLEMSKEGQAVALVHPGDKVCLRQVIAAIPDGSYIHASVSGTVLGVESRPHPWGGSRPAIVIQNDLMDTPDEHVMPPLAPNMVNLEVLIDRVRKAGIVGMGGGAYPTWLKLKQAAGRVDTLIVNAAESEPYVTADYRLMMERSDRILQGAQTIGRCLGAKRTVVGTAGDKIKAVEIIERRLRRRKGLELVTVRARYPLGAERQIVQPEHRLPRPVRAVEGSVLEQLVPDDRLVPHRAVYEADGLAGLLRHKEAVGEHRQPGGDGGRGRGLGGGEADRFDGGKGGRVGGRGGADEHGDPSFRSRWLHHTPLGRVCARRRACKPTENPIQ